MVSRPWQRGLRLYMRIATARKYLLLVGVLGELTD